MSRFQRGHLFVFEGPDGVGKTTLAKELADYFTSEGIPHSFLAFPGKEIGSLGHHVYQLHHDLERFNIKVVSPVSLQILHIAAHVDVIERVVAPALYSGQHVILDRFWWSTWVYGTANNVSQRSLKIMIKLEMEYWKNIRPHIVFLITRTKSLRATDNIDKWNSLQEIYQKLAEEQKLSCPILEVFNEESVASALQKIISALPALQKPEKQNKTLSEKDGQLTINFFRPTKPVTLIAHLEPIKPTEVFDTYWRFAAERQEIFFRKLRGMLPPWTKDSILGKHKFTNAYRVLDRVSQFLIRDVIYKGSDEPQEVFFRILMFKIFNNVPTWELLLRNFGNVEYATYSFEHYDQVLTKALESKQTIFSAAYIMPSGNTSFGYNKKHRNYLRLLEKLMDDEVPARIGEMKSMREVFELLRSYPMVGDFLAYQYATDINYSNLTNFSEMEFVMPGPGALEGIRKCFTHLGGLNEVDIICMMAERQEREFARLEINFKSLFGRRLQLIDCQNLFCEVDKYARIAHPEIKGKSGRKKIKQIYQLNAEKIDYCFPPKWKLHIP